MCWHEQYWEDVRSELEQAATEPPQPDDEETAAQPPSEGPPATPDEG